MTTITDKSLDQFYRRKSSKRHYYDYSKIPAEMQKADRWIIWRLDPARKPGNHAQKQPLDPKTGVRHNPTDPKIWTTFVKAKRAMRKYRAAGIGFVLGGGWSCLDIDDISQDLVSYILNPDDRSNPLYKIDRLTGKSFIEISYSKRGLHVFFHGQKPTGSACRNGHFELYDSGRYIAMTGAVYETLREPKLATLSAEQVKKLMLNIGLDPRPITNNQASLTKSGAGSDIGNNLTVDEIITKSKTHGRFQSDLWAGDYGGYPKPSGEPDLSRVDFAIAYSLGIWANRDFKKIKAAMMKTRFRRPKWYERRGSRTYLDLTIDKAIKYLNERGRRGYRGTKKDHGQQTRTDHDRNNK